LFSDITPGEETGPEQPLELEPEEEQKEEALLEEVIVASLLTGKTPPKPPASAIAIPVPVVQELELERDEELVGGPAEGASPRRFGLLRILLPGLVVLGAVLLVLMIAQVVGQGAGTWSNYHTLLIAYTVAVLVMSLQWVLNTRLARFLRDAEGENAQAGRSRRRLEERLSEMASANSLLQRRHLQLQAVLQVSHAISTELTLGDLVREAVYRVRDWFALYYVGLFLTDESGEWALLEAGTDEAGNREREYRGGAHLGQRSRPDCR
jgi:hypothetical protein